MTVQKAGILYQPKIDSTRLKAAELESFLKARGIATWVCSSWEADQALKQAAGTDLLLTVGGDGTILRAVQIAIPAMAPITGINQGKLGFMTELTNDEALKKLPLLLEGKGWLDERAMLEAELVCAGKAPQVFHALNDVVVARGSIARLINIEASVDGQALALYRADGVIVATATGSTGYALAAGGPVLYPQSPEMLLVPVAPHLSPRYPVALSEKSKIVLRVNTYHEATLSIDGHINLALSGCDTVTVRRSPYIARFRRLRPEADFYRHLEEKLRGK